LFSSHRHASDYLIMLKRQRASSPPPTSRYDEEPQTAPPSDPPAIPTAKKRRTAAPLLSAEHRGWARFSSEPESAYDDDSDTSVDDDDADVYPIHSTPPHAGTHTHQTQGANYTATNSLLHDLHLCHLHRVEQDSWQSPPSPHSVTSARQSQPPTPHFSPYSGEDDIRKSMPVASNIPSTHTPADVYTMNNSAVAMQRYENVNKYVFSRSTWGHDLIPPFRLLGSLVLNRRRGARVAVRNNVKGVRMHDDTVRLDAFSQKYLPYLYARRR
jgi:hypothetical protein